jgi:hypothetical protein
MRTSRDFTADEHVVDRLPAYINGTLAPAERAAIETHLERCSGCTTELAAWQAIRAATLSLASDPAPAPAPVLDRLWVAIDQLEEPVMNERMPVQTSMPQGLSFPARLRPHRTEEAGQVGGKGGPQHVLAMLATAALVLLTLGASYVAFQRSHTNGESGQPASIPALVASTPPSASHPAQELLDLPIPNEMIPRGDAIGSGLGHETIPPGTTATWDLPALHVEYVISGTVTVRSTRPSQVVRAGGGGEPESVQSGTEITLEPGDAMMAPRETTSDYTNPGPAPAEILTWSMHEGASFTISPPPGEWVSHDVDVSAQPPFPAGAGRLRLRRIELAPKEELAPPPGTLQFAVTLPENAAGTPTPGSIEHRISRSGAAIRNFGSQPTTVYVVTLEPAAAGTATP